MSELIAQLASVLVELSYAKPDPHVTEAIYHLERAIEIVQKEEPAGFPEASVYLGPIAE